MNFQVYSPWTCWMKPSRTAADIPPGVRRKTGSATSPHRKPWHLTPTIHIVHIIIKTTKSNKTADKDLNLECVIYWCNTHSTHCLYTILDLFIVPGLSRSRECYVSYSTKSVFLSLRRSRLKSQSKDKTVFMYLSRVFRITHVCKCRNEALIREISIMNFCTILSKVDLFSNLIEFDVASFSWTLKCWQVKWCHDSILCKQILTDDCSCQVWLFIKKVSRHIPETLRAVSYSSNDIGTSLRHWLVTNY